MSLYLQATGWAWLRRFAAAAAFTVCAPITVEPAASQNVPSEPATEAKLEELRTRIGALSTRLAEARTVHDTLGSQLRETEMGIGRLVNQLRDIEHRLEAGQRQMHELHESREDHLTALATQREDLARQVRASYAMGRQDYLKLLLNQENPAVLARVLTYYNYFNHARSKRIEAITQRLVRLKEVESSIRQETSALQELQAEKTAMRDYLEQERVKREGLLAKLRSEIREGGDQLERLEQDKRKLEELLAEIQLALTDIPATLDNRKPFPALKGRLPWPSKGKIRHRFGTLRRPGHLRWQGVWISGNAGEEVHAISYGRVAFADWLRGFGLLLIIDHGHGYMSLYGHNQSLHRETGDWVDTGDMVATLGDSGGSNESGLYFEIRYKGVPQDPLSWCNKAASASHKERRL